MERQGLSKEQVAAMRGRGVERDLGSADSAEPAPGRRQEEPLVINVGWLPAEQPMCPHCGTGLHAVRQNAAGDTLFECLQPCGGDGYMAVYRVRVPSWEPYPGRGEESGWRPPIRWADVRVRAQQAAESALAGGGPASVDPPAPAERPGGAWPVDRDHSAAPGDVAVIWPPPRAAVPDPAGEPVAAPVTAGDPLAFFGDSPELGPVPVTSSQVGDPPQCVNERPSPQLSRSQERRIAAQRKRKGKTTA